MFCLKIRKCAFFASIANILKVFIVKVMSPSGALSQISSLNNLKVSTETETILLSLFEYLPSESLRRDDFNTFIVICY